jgi:hypothetical protein
MAKTAVTTLILVCSDRVARMDFGEAPRREVLHSWQATCPPGQLLDQSIEVALASNARCGRNVWVLCEDFWTQVLSVPGAAVAGLAAHQIGRVLAFELESLSGLAAADSEVAFVAGAQEAGHREFWVTQMPAADLRRIQQTIRGAGGRLRGLAHPAGVPLPWQEGDAGRPWRRIEAWGDVTLCLTGRAGGEVGTRFVRSSPGQQDWKEELSRWLAQDEGQQAELFYRWRLPSDDLFEGLAGLDRLPDLEGQAVERWLTLWAEALTGGADRIPLIKPPAQVISRRTYQILSAAAAALALAVCVAHGAWMKYQVQATRGQVARIDGPRRDLAAINKKILAQQADLRKLEDKLRPEGIDPAAEVARQKSRIPALLAALGRLGDEGRVITRLHADNGGGVTIEGLCLRPELADALAVRLGQVLDAQSWQVRGAQKTARMTSPDGGPWEFRVALTPSRITRKPASSAPVAAADAVAGLPAVGKGGAQ